jgi:NADP-dependent 3-hydroxy acid dehydrogenase YdfG
MSAQPVSPVVVITGASSGIGEAAAHSFARRGFRVAGIARDADRLDALAGAIRPSGGDFLPLTADVRDRAAIEAAISATLAHFGRLDVLVANAGVGARGPLIEAAWDDLDTLLRTNIDGVLNSIRAAAPAMRQRPPGNSPAHIIIVSSVTARVATPYAAAYAASKAFVSSLAASLRVELAADDIRVSDLLVGRTATEFNSRRLGAPGRGAGGGGLPEMSPEQVAASIVRTALGRSRAGATLRPFDRLLLLAHALAPGLIARLAARQYR